MNFGLCGNAVERENLSMFFPALIEYVDFLKKYDIILLVVSPTAKWTAKSVSNSNGVATRWLCGNT